MSDQTLYLRGELDLSTRHLIAGAGTELTNRCLAARDRGTRPDISPGGAASDDASGTTAVIDAAGLRFIDAAGLGVLVTLHHDLARAAIGLRTVHASTQLRQVSAICKLDATLGLQPAAPDPRDTGQPDEDRAGTVVGVRLWVLPPRGRLSSRCRARMGIGRQRSDRHL